MFVSPTTIFFQEMSPCTCKSNMVGIGRICLQPLYMTGQECSVGGKRLLFCYILSVHRTGVK